MASLLQLTSTNIVAFSSLTQNYNSNLNCNVLNPSVTYSSTCNSVSGFSDYLDSCYLKAMKVAHPTVTELVAKTLISQFKKELSLEDKCASYDLCQCWDSGATNGTTTDPTITQTCEKDGIPIIDSCWYDTLPMANLYAFLEENVATAESEDNLGMWAQQVRERNEKLIAYVWVVFFFRRDGDV